MTWLEELFISGNKLKSLPTCIVNLKNLKWLSIIDNDGLVLTDEQQMWIDELKANGCKVLNKI